MYEEVAVRMEAANFFLDGNYATEGVMLNRSYRQPQSSCHFFLPSHSNLYFIFPQLSVRLTSAKVRTEAKRYRSRGGHYV